MKGIVENLRQKIAWPEPSGRRGVLCGEIILDKKSESVYIPNSAVEEGAFEAQRKTLTGK